ncbi:MAG: adenosylcobinamide-phosphate synthase CbiB [bacterium]|jgi:adenosylcobinamide-phosphate synthase
MTLTLHILAAVGLDLMIGDPRWLPHPVRGIGWLAQRLEAPLRRLLKNEYAAGVLVVLLVVGSTAFAVWGLIHGAMLLHPVASDIVSILAIYTAIAPRDLARHSMSVYHELKAGDLPLSRKRVAMIVGRDTDTLDEADVTRAAVECVAESTVDGVTAPLFFALLAGPLGAMTYRAINTLDSTFGYLTPRYCRFGWASARLDDLANYLPARLTAPLIGVAAVFLNMRPLQSWCILRRDGRKHASPNSGLPEAAMAGALGVQLGGTAIYDGEPLEKPTIGDALTPLTAQHILQANLLMFTTMALFLALGLLARRSF